MEIIEGEDDENEKEEAEESPIEQEKVTYTDAEYCVNQTLRFLYEQGPEFGEVEEEVQILRKLHKRVRLNVINNLKQADLHYYFQ